MRSWKDFFPSVYAFIYAFLFFTTVHVRLYLWWWIDLYGIHVFPKNHGAFLHCFVQKKRSKDSWKVYDCVKRYIEIYHDCVSSEASFICLIFSNSPLRKETIWNRKKSVKCWLVHIEREREATSTFTVTGHWNHLLYHHRPNYPPTICHLRILLHQERRLQDEPSQFASHPSLLM